MGKASKKTPPPASDPVEESEEMFFSFHDTLGEVDSFEDHNPLKKKRKSSGRKKLRRSSFGVAAAAINSEKKKKIAEKMSAVPATTNKLPSGRSPIVSRRAFASASKAAAPASASVLLSKSLTKPVAPTLHTEQRFKNARSATTLAMKRSEELLLEKIQLEKKLEREKLERAKQMYQKLKANGFRESAKKPLCASSSRPNLMMRKPTIPQAPKSMLEQRMAARKAARETLVAEPAAAKKPLARKSVAVPATATTSSKSEPVKRGPTIPVPFKLASEKRAQQQAHSQVVEEEQFVFKARALDRRIFEGRGTFGVPKIAVKPPTVPLEVELHSDKRAFSPRRLEREREEREKLEQRNREREAITPFRARPLPATLREPEKLPTPPAKAHFQPTIAVSPKFHTNSNRASSAPPRKERATLCFTNNNNGHDNEKERQRDVRKSIAHTPAPTQPQEFRFATAVRSEKHRQTLLEEEIRRRAEEERQREVRAHPVPDFSKVFVPKSSAKEPTVPQPFSLQSIQLHEESLMEFQREVEEERRREREAALVKAKAVPKTLYEPEHIEKENEKIVTIPVGMKLESDVRAKKRAEFDELMSKRLSEQERKELEMEKTREDQENRELKQRRRKSIAEGGLQFKAQPILTEDPYPVKNTPKAFEPTIPRSPKLSLKERRATKMNEVGAEAGQSSKFRNF